MKAIYFNQHGGPEVLKFGDFPTPTPGPQDVLVKVKACALNHLDIWVRMGIPGLSVHLPHILGADVAGVIESVGADVFNWKSGQKVLVAPGISCGTCAHCQTDNDHLCDKYDILGQQSNGGYAEYVKVPAANLLPFPDPLTFDEAASLPLVFLTAWHMLVTNGNVQKGQTVLIHAGGSGVGIAAIQIAKLKGAHVITTVGSPEKGKRAKALGADDMIHYRETNFQQEVMRITNNRGVDLAVDHIGQETFEKSLLSIAKGGKLLTCGATSGRQIQFDLRTLFGRNITIHGSRMGQKKGLQDVMEHVKSGRLKPILDSVYPLKEAPQAHTRMEERKNFGKIILTH
ncbi:MAG: zinc-binding dehydrogenase [Elusimicrobia bacterium]|nr:zinc-binding dehydrogenase [Elusimicrobiota bacterium]